jgi:Holliday junction resolvasome RuvABC ATP-dependent DNA helicase subunit
MHVGIEHQKKELTLRIMDGRQELRVVSIVGFGGLGKTTLANEVYREVRGHFDCTAFVSVSQMPDMTRLLNRLISQFGQQKSSHVCNVQDHINCLREYLREKRYSLLMGVILQRLELTITFH